MGLSGKSIPSKRSVRTVSGESKKVLSTETERGDYVGTRTEGHVDLCEDISLSEPEVSRREGASSKHFTPHPTPSPNPLEKERKSLWL